MSDDQLKEVSSSEYQVMPPDSPYAALADEIYREKVLRARKMPPKEKILAGQSLFEAACRITLSGIRNQFPGHTEEYYREVLRQRLILRRRLEASQNFNP